MSDVTTLPEAILIPASTKGRVTHRRWLYEDMPFYLVAVLATLLVAALYLLSRHSGGDWAWSGLPLDDNWIHLVYARSLAEQGGFYYNPGVPEAGMSSPFWAILLALVYKLLIPLGVSPQWCAKGLTLFFALGVPIVTYHLVRTLKIEHRWAWAAGLLVIVEPNLAYGNVAGMEVPLFTLLTLLALWLSWQQRYWWTGLVLGLLVITRAEGVVTALLIGTMPLVRSYLRRQQVTLITGEELNLGVKLFLPALLLGSTWALGNYLVNRTPLPNTYFVKHNFALGYFNLENLLNVLLGYVGHLTFFKGMMLPLTIGLALAAGYAFYHRRQIMEGLSLVLIVLVQLYAFSINIKVVAVETPWTYFTRRYLDFLLPLWSIVLVVGLAFFWEVASQRRNRIAVLFTPLLTFVTLLALGIGVISTNNYFMEQYSWNTENVEQVNVAAAKWVGANLPAEVTIAVTDAGAMRFWSRPDQRVVDFLGLNCSRCIGRPAEELMNEFKPDYVVFFRQAITDPTLYREVYHIQATRNTVLGGNDLVVLEVLKLPPWPPR